MDRFGLGRIESLYALSPAVLTPRFRALAVRRLAQALGAQAESLSPRQAPAAFLTRQIFAETVSEDEDLASAVPMLLQHLRCALLRDGRGARLRDLSAYRPKDPL